MRFEEAYEGWSQKRFTQEEAARLLGVCDIYGPCRIASERFVFGLKRIRLHTYIRFFP